MKTHREIAEHMVRIHGGILAARDWSEAHAASNIGRNPAARAHWDAVSKELTEMHRANKKPGVKYRD